MHSCDPCDDSQSQPASARVTVARLLKPNESLEDPAAVLRGDASSVIVYPEDHVVVLLRKRHSHRDNGMPEGVVEEIVHQPGELFAISDHSPCRHPSCVNCSSGELRYAFDRFENHIIQIEHYNAAVVGGRILRPGEEEQVLDQALQAEILIEHDLGECLRGDLARMFQGDFGMLPDAGNG